ncbi:MAG TPA: heparan-alpha-glucosaminide N-acetyltransferase domain-containing protein [Puia sp.]|nr:heparan-alpha-glucosaminide N-acetyltransferase domain-containing protein [Puia sp.]
MTVLTATRNRIASIDLLRGVVMVIMALDHTRDFFHVDAFMHNPLDLKTTTPILFFTRWITHFCAPVFLFLSGMSAYLMGLKKTKKELSGFLIKRGLWLVFIEVVVITFAFTFNPLYNTIILQVIWAIGVSMIILGILVYLPFRIILIIGCIIVFGHNLLDYPEAANNQKVGLLWEFVHHGNFTFINYAPNHVIAIIYAFLPWTGIMIMGYCMGKIFSPSFSSAQRRKILLYLGSGLILFFILIRWVNRYGDPVPWSVQSDSVRTFLSFIKVNKYPPSLMYTAMTLGPALIFLALTENTQNRITSIFSVYGRVPFFYYVIHFYIIHLLSMAGFFLTGCGTKDIVTPNFPFFFRPPQFGFQLWVVYVVWIFVVLILYPVCRWYDRYKSTHRQWWLSYL